MEAENILNLVLNGALVVILAIIGLFLKRLFAEQDRSNAKHERHQAEINEIKVMLPTSYVRRDDLQAIQESMTAYSKAMLERCDRMEAAIKDDIKGIYTELKGKVDKPRGSGS
jgi:hypothetical protein